MRYINATLPTPQHNLAADEALLDVCEQTGADEIIRFWESAAPFVVLGYSNKIATEANLEACRLENVPVLRRCSGGGAVVQGPGCLNYSLVLRIPESGPLTRVTDTNHFIMHRHADIFAKLTGEPVTVQGHSDLVIGARKFSGNAQRRKRRYLMFHGCFLLNLDLELIERLLPMPSRQPDYRQSRSHRDFLVNLHLPSDLVVAALREGWQADTEETLLPLELTDTLVQSRYARHDWIHRA
jgi:lipoate-protein ligase A